MVAKMEWLLLSNIIIIIQLGSVIFGTALAAPLLSSLSPIRRRYGFKCMAIGSMFSLLATASAGLLVLSFANGFWFLSSIRGWWLLSHQNTHPISQAETVTLVATEAVSKAAEVVAEVITETVQTATEVIQSENRPPDAI